MSARYFGARPEGLRASWKLGVLAGAVLAVSGCVYEEPGYGYSDYDSVPYSGPNYVGSGYAGGYYAPGYYPGRYGYGPVFYGDGHHHHENERSGRDHGDEKLRLTDASSRHGDRNHPEGWHSREWFERRGYDTGGDRFEDRAGHRFGRQESHREASGNRGRGDHNHRDGGGNNHRGSRDQGGGRHRH